MLFRSVSFKACVSLFIFILDDLSTGVSEVLKFSTIIVCVGYFFLAASLYFSVLISYLILVVREEKGKNLSSLQPLLVHSKKDIRPS